MPSKKPMAARRVYHLARVNETPRDWEPAYGWLRAELCDLDRACESSLMLRLRTRRARLRTRHDATSLLLLCAMSMDDAYPLSPWQQERRAMRRIEVTEARTDDERMWRARGWLLTAEAELGDAGLRDQLMAALAISLTRLAGALATVRRSG